MRLLFILGSTFIVSVVALVGIVTLAIKEKFLKTILFLLVAFSAGALIGGAFLHLMPEAIEQSDTERTFVFVIAGFILFFLLEKYLHWRHCHDGICKVHAFTYLNLVGDSVHNFIDGMVIAVSFMTSINLGFVTTLLIIAHEIPQELGDFGVLIYGGFSKKKALVFNFLTALTAFLGAILAYFLSDRVTGFSYILLSLTAGGFIYIASSDLVPEIHKEPDPIKSSASLIVFILGITLMFVLSRAAH